MLHTDSHTAVLHGLEWNGESDLGNEKAIAIGEL